MATHRPGVIRAGRTIMVLLMVDSGLLLLSEQLLEIDIAASSIQKAQQVRNHKQNGSGRHGVSIGFLLRPSWIIPLTA